MPYALLALGVLVGLYGLYLFLLNATPRQAGTMVITILTGIMALALFLLAITGRLPAALAILAALWPVAVGFLRQRGKTRKTEPAAKTMTRAEALEILGLNEPAGTAAIDEAYKRLMLKVHPDQQGSEWMAAKLNAARDFLLKKRV